MTIVTPEADKPPMRLSQRLHWLMYALYYPAVLGTGIVVTLQHAAPPWTPIFVAVTAGGFFSLSFASAVGLDNKYGTLPFLIDIVEVVGMFACFVSLKFIEAPAWLPPAMSTVRSAYILLILIMLLQLGWRAAMGFEVCAYLDLKVIMLVFLALGAYFGNGPEWFHWVITLVFFILAGLYVSHNPYEKSVPKCFVGKLLK